MSVEAIYKKTVNVPQINPIFGRLRSVIQNQINTFLGEGLPEAEIRYLTPQEQEVFNNLINQIQQQIDRK